MTLYSAAIILIIVMDPIGNIPPFLSVLSNFDSRRRKFIILREMIIAFVIRTVFLFFGKYILTGLHISEPALGISGGVMLFIIAIKMIFPDEFKAVDPKAGDDPMIVPLAVPLIAGPSSMAMVILFSTQYPNQMWSWFTALAAAWAVCSLILLLADFLQKILGQKIIKAIERLMGMLLTTMAVQMLLNGIKEFVLK